LGIASVVSNVNLYLVLVVISMIAFLGPLPTATAQIDLFNQHLACYPIPLAIAVNQAFTVRDQFGITNVQVGASAFFCQSALKIPVPATPPFTPLPQDLHFVCYNVIPNPQISPTIRVTDQIDRLGALGPATGPILLCAPAEKGFPGGPPPPPIANPLIHLLCYLYTGPAGEDDFVIVDQFNNPTLPMTSVKVGLAFCETASKVAFGQIPPPPIRNEQFSMRLTPNGPTVPMNIPGIIVVDQFNPGGVTIPLPPGLTSNRLLVPAQKSFFGLAVGGDIIPLDSTMVLAAGAQYTAAWMIPAIVSAIGIGIVIARKF